jgi:intracellular multiplication protein IcmC
MGEFPSLDQILVNLNKDLPILWKFLQTLTYFIGLWFAIRAMYILKQYAETRSMTSAGMDIKKPLINFIVATVLLYWPSLMNSTLQTFFLTSEISPFQYSSQSESRLESLIKISGGLVQFIGFIAFVRGWMLMTHLGESNVQPGTFGKALMHIIGGILAINIYATWGILKSLAGLQ